jgi:hypothetical protein
MVFMRCVCILPVLCVGIIHAMQPPRVSKNASVVKTDQQHAPQRTFFSSFTHMGTQIAGKITYATLPLLVSAHDINSTEAHIVARHNLIVIEGLILTGACVLGCCALICRKVGQHRKQESAMQRNIYTPVAADEKKQEVVQIYIADMDAECMMEQCPANRKQSSTIISAGSIEFAEK